MKILLLTILFTFYLNSIYSQDKEPNALIESDGFKNIGFMASPSFGMSQMDQASVALFSIRGGIVFDDQFTLGGFYTVTMNEFIPSSETSPDIYMDYRAFGGLIEYTVYAHKTFHATIPLLIGAGEVEMDSEYGSINLGESNFLVVQPSIMLEVNLHKYVRLNFGLGYRIIGNMNYRNLNQNDLEGITGEIGIKFGLFKN